MKVNSSQFTVDQSTKTLVADISDLGPDFRFERIYPDACDEGLTLVSATSGNEATFYLCGPTRDRDGDVKYWTLRPTNETCRKYPILAGSIIRLYND